MGFNQRILVVLTRAEKILAAPDHSGDSSFKRSDLDDVESRHCSFYLYDLLIADANFLGAGSRGRAQP